MLLTQIMHNYLTWLLHSPLARAPDVILFDLEPLIEDGNLQVYMHCVHARRRVSGAPRTHFTACKPAPVKYLIVQPKPKASTKLLALAMQCASASIRQYRSEWLALMPSLWFSSIPQLFLRKSISCSSICLLWSYYSRLESQLNCVEKNL